MRKRAGVCPQCGERVSPFAAACAICGADLRQHRPEPPRRRLPLPALGGRGSAIAWIVGVAAAVALVAVGLGRRDHATPGPGVEATPPGLGSCDAAQQEPAIGGSREAAAATLCLLNLERHAYGLGALRESAALDGAALRRARAIVRRHRVGHRRSRESVAWGQDQQAAPVFIVARWLATPEDRAIILRPDVDRIGIGVVPRPIEAQRLARGATYAATFAPAR